MAATLDLAEATVQFQAVPSRDRPRAFRELAARIRRDVREGDVSGATVALRRMIVPELDYTSFQSLYRIYRSLPVDAICPRTTLAVLGGTTTTKLAMAIELAAFAMGGRVETVESHFGIYRQEILDGHSALYQARPNTIFLSAGWRELAHRPTLSNLRDEVAQLVDAEIAQWAGLWRAAHERLGCQIIQNNFDRPAWRQLGNHEPRHPGGLDRFISLLNQAIADRAPPYVVIHDVDELAAAVAGGPGATTGSTTIPRCPVRRNASSNTGSMSRRSWPRRWDLPRSASCWI